MFKGIVLTWSNGTGTLLGRDGVLVKFSGPTPKPGDRVGYELAFVGSAGVVEFIEHGELPSKLARLAG
jgi:hypothetical protein